MNRQDEGPSQEGENNGQLRRALGLGSLLFYGVGVIVGAGIYSVIGGAAAVAGDGLWISFLLAAVPAIFAALCYAELSSMYPRAGAAYVYLHEAFPSRTWVSFATGFVLVVAGAATAATVALAFGGYLSLFVGDIPMWFSALFLLVICTVLNILGIRESAWATIFCTLIEVGGLALIVAAGVITAEFGAGMWATPHMGLLSGAALIFFVYTGFEGIANLAEEAKDPQRNIPKALLISVALTTVLYLLVAIAAVSLLSPQELGASSSPLAAAAGVAAPWLSTVLAWIALFSTANTALITVVVISRLLFGMANGGELPSIFGAVLARRRTPWVAALTIFAASCLFLPLGGITIVASLSSFATLAAFAGVSTALIALRFLKPNQPRPFRIPMTIRRVPVVPVLAIISVLALMTQFEPGVYLASLVVAIFGIGIYWLQGWGSTRTQQGASFSAVGGAEGGS